MIVDRFDALVKSIMQELGCDSKTPPHWVQHTYKSSVMGWDVPDGYVCSRCGKHSWTKKTKCDGCDSIMSKEESHD